MSPSNSSCAGLLVLLVLTTLARGGGGEMASDVSVWSVTRGVRVLSGGETRMPFSDKNQLRSELHCVDGRSSLHYMIRSRSRYGSIMSVASSDPSVLEPQLLAQSTRAAGVRGGGGSAGQHAGVSRARGGSRVGKPSTLSAMLDEGETPITVSTKCKGVGDAIVVTVSLSMQTASAEATRELIFMESVCCSKEDIEAEALVEAGGGDASGCLAMCSHRGSCVRGLCICSFGYHGVSCEKRCPGGEESPCSLRGRCDGRTGLCECIPGYHGTDCSKECPGGAENPCNGHGACSPEGTCLCNEGFTGVACHTSALRPAPVHISCPSLHHSDLVRGGSALPEYASLEASKAVPLKGVSGVDCVWHAGEEGLSYSFMTASSDATVVDLSLSVPAQGTIGSGKAPLSLSMPCKAQGDASLWIQIVLLSTSKQAHPSDQAMRPVELFFGRSCSHASSTASSAGTCSDCLHGTCEDGLCTCKPGYWGEACSSLCPGEGCGGSGVCNPHHGNCLCYGGRSGEGCTEHGGVSSDCVGGCSGHGTCVGGICECEPGWTGASCELDGCTCSGHGTCELGRLCTCGEGWGGEWCEERVKKGASPAACNGGCNGKGVCDAISGVCRCLPGYEGHDCSSYGRADCPNHCSGHGRCGDGGECYCVRDWGGEDCSQRVRGDDDSVRSNGGGSIAAATAAEGRASEPVEKQPILDSVSRPSAPPTPSSATSTSSHAPPSIEQAQAGSLRASTSPDGVIVQEGGMGGEAGASGQADGVEADSKEPGLQDIERVAVLDEEEQRRRAGQYGALVNASLLDAEWRKRLSRRRQMHSADGHWINLITWLLLICVAGVYFLSGKRMRGGPGAREEERLLEWLRQSLSIWNRDKKEAESQACAA